MNEDLEVCQRYKIYIRSELLNFMLSSNRCIFPKITKETDVYFIFPGLNMNNEVVIVGKKTNVEAAKILLKEMMDEMKDHLRDLNELNIERYGRGGYIFMKDLHGTTLVRGSKLIDIRGRTPHCKMGLGYRNTNW